MCKLINVTGGLLIAASTLTAANINLDFLKRLAADKKKHDELQTEGKPQKAQNIWDQNNNKLQSLFKAGVWYSLPAQCAATRQQYSDRIHIECELPDLKAQDLAAPKIDLNLLWPKLTLKWEDATNDTPYDIKFRIARYRDIDSAYIKTPWKTGYIHTSIEGFTLYVDAFQILGKKKVPDQKTTAQPENDEKMSIMIREVSPSLKTIDPLPEKLPKPKSCYAPNDAISKQALIEMQKIVKEKGLPLEDTDLYKFGSLELCSLANPDKTDDACLDACIEKVFEAWK